MGWWKNKNQRAARARVLLRQISTLSRAWLVVFAMLSAYRQTRRLASRLCLRARNIEATCFLCTYVTPKLVHSNMRCMAGSHLGWYMSTSVDYSLNCFKSLSFFFFFAQGYTTFGACCATQRLRACSSNVLLYCIVLSHETAVSQELFPL